MSSQIRPRAYQEKILDKLVFLNSCALFMGTGSGKTYTSLFKLQDFPTKNLLVITPTRVIPQWVQSIQDVYPEFNFVDLGKGNAKSKNAIIANFPSYGKGGNVIIASIEIIKELSSLNVIVTNDWAIILDESHKIKELGTKRSPVKWTHAVLSIGKRTKYKIILTATPTQKDLGGYIDYYTQLRFLGYMNISIEAFKSKYCVMEKKHIVGMPYPINVIKGYKNTKELDSILQDVAVRYTPKFSETEPEYIKIKLPKTTSYKRLEKQKFYEDLDLKSLTARRIAKKTLTGGKILGKTIYGEVRKYEDNTSKIDYLREFLQDVDGRVLIFYKYNVEKEMLISLCQEIGAKFIIVNGETKDKYSAVNNTDWDICLGQVNACGESIDGFQYKCHISIYYSMPESSIEYVQSLGRINRDGQTHVPVYYFLVMEKTIDDDIWDMIHRKLEFSEEILNKLGLEE